MIPKALVDEAAEAPDDEAIQTTALARAIAMVDGRKQSLVGEYIDELQYRQVPGNGMRPGKAMLKAFINQAAFIQNLKERTGGLFSPGTSLQFLLRKILTGWDVQAAGKALLDAVGSDTPAAVLATFWVWRAREAGILPAEGAEVGDVIDNASLAERGRRAMAAINAESDGKLRDAPYYWDILHVWMNLGSAADAKQWLSATATADAHQLAKVSRGILAYSMDGGRRVYMFRGLGNDRAFYDPKVLLAACEAFAAAPSLDEDEAARILALHDGMRAARDDERAQAKTKASDKSGKTPQQRLVKPKPAQA